MLTLRVTAESINVRRTPDTTSPANILTQLPRDREVTGEENPAHPDWYFIRFQQDGAQVEGWVVRRLMRVVQPSTPPAPPKPPRFRVNTDSLNVRSSPSSDTPDNIITQVRRGDILDAKAEQPNDKFLQVSFGQNAKIVEGWVSRRLVINADAPTTPVWRLGMNLREFVYYGQNANPFAPAPESLQLDQLNKLKTMGVKLVRIFAAHESANRAQAAALVRRALDRIHTAGMQAVLCMNDSLTGYNMIVQGERDFHDSALPNGHFHKRYFHDRLYRQHYIPFVETVLGAVKDHPALLIVELGNEYAIHPQPATTADADAFIAFADEAAAVIKRVAPRALVSTGLINCNQFAPGGQQQAYSMRLHGLPTIDAITFHYYHKDGEKDKAPVEIAVAKALKKPFYAGEIGIDTRLGEDRAAFYDRDIAEYKGLGAFSVMPWSFYANATPRDVGVCDLLGIGPVHGDFDAVCAAIAKYAL